MALSFLLDEHLRGLHRAVLRHDLLGGLPIDAVCVGDLAALPLGMSDPDILVWAAQARRITVTLDRETMPGHLADHLRQGLTSPGILVLTDRWSWREMVDYLALVANAGTEEEFRDMVRFAS